MSNSEVTEEKAYTVISYDEVVVFNYTLADEKDPQSLDRELTFIWEDSIEKFIEEHGAKKPYKVHSFEREREKKKFIDQLEGLTDDLIDEVQEDIANKMKFGFEFTGPLHNDD